MNSTIASKSAGAAGRPALPSASADNRRNTPPFDDFIATEAQPEQEEENLAAWDLPAPGALRGLFLTSSESMAYEPGKAFALHSDMVEERQAQSPSNHASVRQRGTHAGSEQARDLPTRSSESQPSANKEHPGQELSRQETENHADKRLSPHSAGTYRPTVAAARGQMGAAGNTAAFLFSSNGSARLEERPVRTWMAARTASRPAHRPAPSPSERIPVSPANASEADRESTPMWQKNNEPNSQVSAASPQDNGQETAASQRLSATLTTLIQHAERMRKLGQQRAELDLSSAGAGDGRLTLTLRGPVLRAVFASVSPALQRHLQNEWHTVENKLSELQVRPPVFDSQIPEKA